MRVAGPKPAPATPKGGEEKVERPSSLVGWKMPSRRAVQGNPAGWISWRRQGRYLLIRLMPVVQHRRVILHLIGA
jgi:hypothetical protein